jgi:hypothetical protein
MMPILLVGVSILQELWVRIMVWYHPCNAPKGGVVSFLSMPIICDEDNLNRTLKGVLLKGLILVFYPSWQQGREGLVIIMIPYTHIFAVLQWSYTSKHLYDMLLALMVAPYRLFLLATISRCKDTKSHLVSNLENSNAELG